ncbi:hypothetical protein LCGC14_2225200 [marine sediment metagenome]|uniref:Uncharacterized protein n=1 Tax=marine sediment metagenome TaxID=412755 RepID=A0A0F9G5B3_9ZZZZ
MTIKEAKKNLYHLLLKKNVDDLTENEVDIMWLLTKDREIWEILEKGRGTNEQIR